MSMRREDYFGVFIRLEKIPEKFTDEKIYCPNGCNHLIGGNFCSICGEKYIKEEFETVRLSGFLEFCGKHDDLYLDNQLWACLGNSTYDILIPNRGTAACFPTLQNEGYEILSEKYNPEKMKEIFKKEFEREIKILEENFVINIYFGVVTYYI